MSLSCQTTGLTPVKWFPPRRDDEELTSAGTMAARGKGHRGHRPGDRLTVVFDPGVPTPCGDNLRARSLGQVTGSAQGLDEGTRGRVRLWRPGALTLVPKSLPSSTKKNKKICFDEYFPARFLSLTASKHARVTRQKNNNQHTRSGTFH